MKSSGVVVRGGRGSVRRAALFMACAAAALVVSSAQAQTTGTWSTTTGWKKEPQDAGVYFRQFGDRTPEALNAELQKLMRRLASA